MIGPGFTFDRGQRAELILDGLNDRQIDALERIVPACAIYLAPLAAATLTETRDILEGLQKRHLPALMRLFAHETASPAEQEALVYIGRNMDLTQLSDFGQTMRTSLPAILAAVDKALAERNAEGQKRTRHSTAPLHLIYRALHDNHLEAVDTAPTPLETPQKFRFYPSQPSQGSQGPFEKVADAIYIKVTGQGVPKRALRSFHEEVRLLK